MEHFYKNIHGWDDGIPDFYKMIVNSAENGMHFVEVGTWKGRSAAYMCVEIANSGKQIQFDCVDTWEGSPLEPDHMNDPHVLNKSLYEHFLENMEKVKDYYNPIKMTSVDASKCYKDASLNFVFIDAAHDYNSVCEDIKAWLPKVKVGGIISGHDYWQGNDVTRAVNDTLTDFSVGYGVWFKQIK